MKQAIQIGAGNIGRGFIGALLSQAGWHVTFADVVEPIIEALNRHHGYTVHILDRDPGEITISGVDGVISTSPEFAQRVAQCDRAAVEVDLLVNLGQNGAFGGLTAGLEQLLIVIQH